MRRRGGGARIEFKRMLIREMEVIRVNYEVKRRPNDVWDEAR